MIHDTIAPVLCDKKYKSKYKYTLFTLLIQFSNHSLSGWFVKRSATTRWHSCFHNPRRTSSDWHTSEVTMRMPFKMADFVWMHWNKNTTHRLSYLPNSAQISEIEDIMKLCRSWQHLYFCSLPNSSRYTNKCWSQAAYLKNGKFQ